ncbi:hypothetical protein ACGFKZ_29470 [Micromonospora tulbaghiae]|uniref:hypothetical protein n=1 Tax=Micromonospora tulbaghiae TaxID=479978 RepID=UPI003721B6D3
MVFPADPLPVRGALYMGAAVGWVDVTDDMRLERAASGGGVTITRGRGNEASDADPTGCAVTLNNAGGKYSPRNPVGPYLGLIGRNTPLRVAVGPPAQAAAMWGVRRGAGGLSTPDHPTLRITGDIDVRFYGRGRWTAGPGELAMDLGGRYNANGNQRSWQVYCNRRGVLGVLWSPDGTLAARRELFADAPVSPAPDGTLAVRVTLDVDNGAGGVTARFYQAPTLAGPWVQLGTDRVAAGASSIHAGTAPLQLGETPSITERTFTGDLIAAELRDGIDGTLVAAPDLTTVPDLTVRTFVDAVGRTWSAAPTVALVDRSIRAITEVASWPPRWDLSGRDLWVPVQGSGVLRRLSQGAATLRSPVYRTFVSYNPLAYLPLEEGSDATRPASAAAGIPYGTATDVEYGADAGVAFGGTAGAAKMTTVTASISTPVRAGSAANGHWSAAFYVRLAAAPFAGDRLMFRARVAGGSVARYELFVSSSTYRWVAYDAAGAVVGDRTSGYGTGAEPTRWVAFALDVFADSGGTRWAGVWHGIGSTAFYASQPGGDFVAGPIGNVTSVELLGSDYAVDALFAHLVVTPNELPFVREEFRRVSTGYAGERAGERIYRLAGEAGVAVEMVGDPTQTEACGPQKPATLVELLRAAARVDGGILQESRSLLGLYYRTRRSLYNQVATPLSYAGGQLAEPFEPVDDDDAVTNDVTVSRSGGGSARATRATGPLSTAAPPAGVGIYDTSVTLDVAADGQLPDQAGWRLHLGTVDEARYPRIRADLAAPGYTPELAAAAAAVDAGDLLALTDLPAWLPPGPTPAMVQGYTEKLDAYTREITYTATPGSPWTVGVVAPDSQSSLDDGPAVSRFAGDSTLAAPAAAAATRLQTTSSVIGWTLRRGPAYPLRLNVGGEQLDIGMVGDVITTNPWIVDGLTGWGGMGGTLALAPAVTRGPYATLRVTPSAGTASSVRALSRVTAAAGQVYALGAWILSPGGWPAGVQVVAEWADASNTALTAGVGPLVAIPAGVWTWVEAELLAPATTTSVRYRVTQNGTQTAANIWHATQLIITPRSTYAGLTQTLTVAPGGRGLNGAPRDHAAGVAVDVWHNAHIPL